MSYRKNFNYSPEKDGGSGPEAPPESPSTIQLDGQSIELARVKELLAREAQVQAKADALAQVELASKRYGLNPEELIGQADAAFGVLTNLVDAGILDQDGNLIKPKEAPAASGVPASPKAPSEAPAEIEKLVQEGVQKALGGLGAHIEKISKAQDQLIRDRIGTEIKRRFPDLSDREVGLIINEAARDSKKDIATLAAAVVETNKASKTKIEDALLGNLGMTRAQYAQVEQVKGGALPDLTGGRKLVLRGRSGTRKEPGEKTITAKEAALSFVKLRERF